MSIYSNDPRKPHSSTHINVDHNNGTFTVNTKDSSGNKSSNTGNCFLTSACMRFLQDNFDDNCYELKILRWFRDNYVSAEDVEHYYQIAPLIVDGIESSTMPDVAYDYIYENVIIVCIEAIEQGDYEFAYNRYKNSVLCFEKSFVKPRGSQGRILKIK